MKRSLKFLPLFLAVAVFLTSCSAGSRTGESSSKTSSSSASKIVVAYSLAGSIPADQDLVQTELNKITQKKINTGVTLLPIPQSTYSQKINLMISGGEQLDIMFMQSNFSQAVAQNELIPMDDLLKQYGSGIVSAVGDDFLKATTVNGKIYAVTCMNGKASVPSFICRKDILDKYGLSLDNVKTLDDIGKLFAVIHKQDPKMTCLAPFMNTTLIWAPGMLLMDDKYDSLGDGIGALLGNDNYHVVDAYETDQYKQIVTTMRDWYQKSYILKDAATTTESGPVLMKGGNMFSTFLPCENGGDTLFTTASGFPCVQKKLQPALLATGSLSNNSWGIPVTCKSPESQQAAMKFLNLMYTDSGVVNLMDYGIEGKHYVKQPDGTIDFPEGINGGNSGYYPNMNSTTGNQLIGYVWKGNPPDYYKTLDKDNKAAAISNALGFSFDNSSVKSQYTAVNNVISQYEPGLDSGSIDPATMLPKFISALKSAGINDIIKAKQTQLDAWVKANKK